MINKLLDQVVFRYVSVGADQGGIHLHISPKFYNEVKKIIAKRIFEYIQYRGLRTGRPRLTGQLILSGQEWQSLKKIYLGQANEYPLHPLDSEITDKIREGIELLLTQFYLDGKSLMDAEDRCKLISHIQRLYKRQPNDE